jgi:hypothetical protein
VLEIRRDNAGYAAPAHPRALTADDVSQMLARRGAGRDLKPGTLGTLTYATEEAAAARARLGAGVWTTPVLARARPRAC